MSAGLARQIDRSTMLFSGVKDLFRQFETQSDRQWVP
jgi:hypothetical protein